MFPRVALTFVAAACLLLHPVFGQRGGAAPPGNGGIPPGGAPGATRGTSPIGTNPSTQIPQPQQQQIPMEQPRTVFLSGRVLTDDGTAPDDSAVIETVCNGSPHAQAYTDSKGRFSFELGGRTNWVMQDASEGHLGGFFGTPSTTADPGTGMFGNVNAADRMLMNCELQAKLPGYSSEVVSLAMHRSFDNPDIGTILIHRLGVVEGRVVSETTLAAPKDARKAFEKAHKELENNKPEEAIKNFQKAVGLYPEYSVAWCELGRLQMEADRKDEAVASLRAAIKADPRFIQPYLYLSILQALAHQWNELALTSGKALKLDPYDYPQAYFFNAMAHFNNHDVDAAEKSAREGEKIDTRRHYPRTWELLGAILASRGDFAGAAEQMRTYLQYSPQAADAARVRAQLAHLEKIGGSASAELPQK